MSEISQEVIDVIVENKDKDDNAILSLMIGLGTPFNKAKGILAKILIEKGLRMSKAQRDEKAAELMETFTASEETTSDEVVEQIELISDELDCTAAVARAYVRAAFIAEDLEMPKAPKAASGPRGPRSAGFNGVAGTVSAYLIANKECTKDEFTAFMVEKGLDKTKSGADKVATWWNVLEDLRVFGTQYSA